jgi:hypothetical protein
VVALIEENAYCTDCVLYAFGRRTIAPGGDERDLTMKLFLRVCASTLMQRTCNFFSVRCDMTRIAFRTSSSAASWLWGPACCFCALLLGAVAPCAAQETSGEASTSSHEARSAASGSAADTTTRAHDWRQRRRAKAQSMRPPEPNFVDKVRALVGRTRSIILPTQVLLDIPSLGIAGLRPAVGGLPSNAGATFGLHYEPPFLEGPGRSATLQALTSINGYGGAKALYGLENGPTVFYAYGRHLHKPQEEFFGIGPDAKTTAESVYQLNETMVGGLLGRSLGPNALLGGHVSYLNDRYGPGTTDGEPQVMRQFEGANVPGVGTDAEYVVAGGFLEYDSRNIPYSRGYGRRFAPTERRLRALSLDASQGLYTAAEVTHYRDVRHSAHSFTRLTLDLQEYLPLEPGAQHGLALRQFASFTQTGADQEVPFYRLQTIGGSRSLRGYARDRFRDRNVFLLNAELRCHVWHWLDMAVFADAGHVFNGFDDLSVGGIRHDVGIGFRFRTDAGTIMRFEVARSPEGVRTYLELGSLL